jgi:hypothetical protein
MDVELLKMVILKLLTSSRDNIIYTKRFDGKKNHLYREGGDLYYEIEKIENGLVKYETQGIDASNKMLLQDFIIENQEIIIEKIKELETNIIALLKNHLLITHNFEIENNMKRIYNSLGSKSISLYYTRANYTQANHLSYKIDSSNITPLPSKLTPLNITHLNIIDTLYTLETLYRCNNYLTNMIFEKTTAKLDRTPAKLDTRGGKRIAPAAPAYKLNGEKVSLLINKKRLHRSVYVKGNGNGKAKYCKINNEFVLLSKLKNKIIE